MRGHVILSKCYGVSKLIYIMKAISVPLSVAKEANTSLFHFLWNNKRHRISNKLP